MTIQTPQTLQAVVFPMDAIALVASFLPSDPKTIMVQLHDNKISIKAVGRLHRATQNNLPNYGAMSFNMAAQVLIAQALIKQRGVNIRLGDLVRLADLINDYRNDGAMVYGLSSHALDLTNVHRVAGMYAVPSTIAAQYMVVLSAATRRGWDIPLIEGAYEALKWWDNSSYDDDMDMRIERGFMTYVWTGQGKDA